MTRRRASLSESPRTRGGDATPLAHGAATDEPARAPFPIVGVGASAGGLEAFTSLLTHLPTDTGMGFVFVQHLDPVHESALTQLLGRATAMPVQEVTNQVQVEPNHVYVIPPNTNLGIVEGRLTLRPRPKTRAPHRSIDGFLQALAADQHELAIGVILSGTATDGTVGLEAIKAEGGITFAQDDSARYDSMPRSAVAAGCVDVVLSPEDIAREIARIARHPQLARKQAADALRAENDRADATAGEEPVGARNVEDGFKKILLLLRNHSGVDFSLYKSTTIQRRITRRLVLTKHDTLERYAEFLRGQSSELDALYSDVLISVTSFFRNPDAFDVLQRTVLPALLQQRDDQPLRFWVLGCSTGQEAYSLAMAFVEAADTAPRMRSLQVFATDLNEALLDKARHGLYAKSIVQDLSPERLRRFFVEEEGGYRVSKALREMLVFARQNVVSDPPFSRLDLISCRNLLMYFEPGLQKKVFPVFHYALKPGGFLFLGASESISNFTELFEPVDKKHKIYVRKASATPAFRLPWREPRGTPVTGDGGPAATLRRPEAAAGTAGDGAGGELSAQREADRISVNEFAPPAVLISADLQILQFRGSTGAFLEPPSGNATLDVLKMARRGLMLPLRTAINQAKKDDRTVRKDGVRIDQEGTSHTVNLLVIPLKNLRERGFLIVFEDAERPTSAARATPGRRGRRRDGASAKGSAVSSEASRRLAALELELDETRDYLRSIQEQHEAGNEELQASNEEVQSANEELQSINEELETSKEELESANEELTTVNEEMASRNAELNRLNSDLINVETSTQQAILLLSRNLTIRRFSAQAEAQFHLLAADIGRPFGSVRHNLRVSDLDHFIRHVIDTVRASEREVQDEDGRWFSLRVRPYVTPDNTIDGAVLVLVDISDLKRKELSVTAARDYAEAIIRTAPDPLLILDADLRVDIASQAFYDTFKVPPTEAAGCLVYDLGNRQWDIPRLRELLEEILPRSGAFDRFEVVHDFETIGRRTMLLNARRLSGAHAPEKILLGIQDVTDLLEGQSRLRESQARYQALIETSAQIVWTTDDSGAVVEDSLSWRAFTGQTLEQRRGSGWLEAIHAEDRARVRQLWYHAVADRIPLDTECRVRHVNGDWRWMKMRAVPVLRADGTVREWVGMNADINDWKQASDALIEANRHKDEFLAMLGHELRNPLAPILASIEILRRTPRREGTADLDLKPRADRALEILQRQVGQMVRLVDDLLDAGRISRGKIDLRRLRIAVAPVVYQAVEASRPLCTRLNHELTVTLPSAPVFLDADASRLAQIVGNLLNNACKFTAPGGHIWLTVEREDAGTPDGAERTSNGVVPQLVLRVRDTGVGIAADRLEGIFDLFTQVDTSLERTSPGLGIGLTLVKTLVEMHGGTVRANSPGLGHGSEFVVRMPIAADAATEAASSPAAEPAVTPLRILVVDDNRDSAEMLATLLTFSGHETHMAHDGPAAVEEATRLDPDLIVLDIGLPGMSGYDVARRIREQNGGSRRPLLVALTGWGQDEDRRRSREAGFDAHVVKPVDEATLHTLLAGLVGAHSDD